MERKNCSSSGSEHGRGWFLFSGLQARACEEKETERRRAQERARGDSLAQRRSSFAEFSARSRRVLPGVSCRPSLRASTIQRVVVVVILSLSLAHLSRPPAKEGEWRRKATRVYNRTAGPATLLASLTRARRCSGFSHPPL